MSSGKEGRETALEVPEKLLEWSRRFSRSGLGGEGGTELARLDLWILLL